MLEDIPDERQDRPAEGGVRRAAGDPLGRRAQQHQQRRLAARVGGVHVAVLVGEQHQELLERRLHDDEHVGLQRLEDADCIVERRHVDDGGRRRPLRDVGGAMSQQDLDDVAYLLQERLESADMSVSAHVQLPRRVVGQHDVQRALAHPIRDVGVGSEHQQQFETLLHLVVVVRLDVTLHRAAGVPQQHVQRRVAVLVADVDVRPEAVVQGELRRLHEAERHLGAVQLVQGGAVLRQEDVLFEVGAVVHQEDGAVGVSDEAAHRNGSLICDLGTENFNKSEMEFPTNVAFEIIFFFQIS